MKIVSIVGARPQFIKAAPVSRALVESGHHEFLLHTGQHYDHSMSQVFFDELEIPRPDLNLAIGSGSHGRQTGQMLTGIEEVLQEQRPDWVLVYGDTNSTLAGALAAAKLQIPLAHVEAGLRSFNWSMPEEVNRVLTDRCSQALFCPTQTAVDNLAREGIHEGVVLTGDVMYDAMLQYLGRIDEEAVLNQYGLTSETYVLATIHRAATTDSKANLLAAVDCLAQSSWPVLLPLHPRTAQALQEYGISPPENVHAIDPISYLHMLALEKNARVIMTDSGGVQKEAYILGVPCVTLRNETEWVETTLTGWNILAGLDSQATAAILARAVPNGNRPALFGKGQAAMQIVRYLQDTCPS